MQSKPLDVWESGYFIATLRWQLFASTIFCDFGILQELNFVICTRKGYRVEKPNVLYYHNHMQENVRGHQILRFGSNPQNIKH